MSQYDEIKNLLKKSSALFGDQGFLKEETNSIKSKHGLLLEMDDENPIKKVNVAKSVETEIEDEQNPKEDKQQSFRISGGIITLHGRDKTDLDLTTDEKIAFQETMDEFVTEVSDLVDFNTLNVYPNNVEWSGKLIDEDIEFIFTIGEDSGIYVNGQMIKVDQEFLTMLNKLQQYYQKFKSKWGKVLASRKKTPESPQ